MNTSEKVVSYLGKHIGMKICDDCLRRELRVRIPISRMLDVLNPSFLLSNTVTDWSQTTFLV